MEQPTEQRVELTVSTLALGARCEFAAMGTTCLVTVVAVDPSRFLDDARARVAHLETLWSRFRDDSDIARINHADGRTVTVSPETARLVAHMKLAHTATDGAFNPALLPSQVALGDDASLVDSSVTRLADSARDFPDLDALVVGPDCTVSAPRGMSLDAGGIGKGLAADLVAAALLDAGAEAACVNLGGDLRVVRRDDSTVDWPVTIAPPRDVDLPPVVVSLATGGLATSDSAVRSRPGRGRHHHMTLGGTRTTLSDAVCDSMIDAVRGATVIASTAAWAEAWTKHAMVARPDATIARLESLGLAGRVVLADGTATTTSTWREFLR